MNKVLLIGQAPSRATDGQEAFAGRSGLRLASLAGLTRDEFLERFDRRNLIDRWPGKNGKGDAFPAAVAKQAAEAITLAARTVFVGRSVAAAFGAVTLAPCEWVERDGRLIALIPHPSGINRWWNDPANADRARSFLTAAASPGFRPEPSPRCATS